MSADGAGAASRLLRFGKRRSLSCSVFKLRMKVILISVCFIVLIDLVCLGHFLKRNEEKFKLRKL